ncbi:MAG: hypothetical protein HYS13_26110 [Planctomycetia bacterium]|nr:hypothetical protein [Planctomycetia bacterium]
MKRLLSIACVLLVGLTLGAVATGAGLARKHAFGACSCHDCQVLVAGDTSQPKKCGTCGGSGQVLSSCAVCGGDGVSESGNTCQSCGGSGQRYKFCPTCGGTGER